MSHIIRDTGESLRSTGEFLNEFLYEDGKPTRKKGQPGVKKQHTYEELWDALESIRVDSWEAYAAIAKEYGWMD